MEVLIESDTPVLLSNAELLRTLQHRVMKRRKQEEKELTKRRRPTKKFQHRDWIEERVYEYLQTTPCVHLDTKKMKELKGKLMASKKSITKDGKTTTTTGFDLTDAESLQILNFMPTEPVEIHLMIEELHARMSEKRQEELLELIRSYRTDAETAASPPDGEDEASTGMAEEQEYNMEVEEDNNDDASNEDIMPISIKQEI